MNAPQVFHGISTEVIVPESSRVRDRFFGSSRRRRYSPRNIRPGSTMEMYWSEASTLTPNEVARVARISPPAVRTARRMRRASACRMPVASSTAPYIIAVMISQTVCSMLSMPPRDSSSSRAAFPDSSTYPPYSACHTPLTRATGRASSGAPV